MMNLKRNVVKLLISLTFLFASSTAFAQSNHNVFNYTIREGNTVYLLSERFNTSVDKIISMNPYLVPENLIVGSKIKITAGSGIKVHKVMKGDTLWRIASKHHSSVAAIAAKNHIENPDLIYAGDILAVPEQVLENDVMLLSKQVVNLFRNRDFSSISKFVHPVKGVRFSPYAYVDVKSDLVFSASKVSKFSSDTKKYTWGVYDGSGESIIFTPAQYVDRFVYRKDFAKADKTSLNKVIGTGNTLENQFEVYPKSSIVEYYIHGTEYYGYMDWESLRLVFEKHNGKWYLIGVIHSQWTI